MDKYEENPSSVKKPLLTKYSRSFTNSSDALCISKNDHHSAPSSRSPKGNTYCPIHQVIHEVPTVKPSHPSLASQLLDRRRLVATRRKSSHFSSSGESETSKHTHSVLRPIAHSPQAHRHMIDELSKERQFLEASRLSLCCEQFLSLGSDTSDGGNSDSGISNRDVRPIFLSSPSVQSNPTDEDCASSSSFTFGFHKTGGKFIMDSNQLYPSSPNSSQSHSSSVLEVNTSGNSFHSNNSSIQCSENNQLPPLRKRNFMSTYAASLIPALQDDRDFSDSKFSRLESNHQSLSTNDSDTS